MYNFPHLEIIGLESNELQSMNETQIQLKLLTKLKKAKLEGNPYVDNAVLSHNQTKSHKENLRPKTFVTPLKSMTNEKSPIVDHQEKILKMIENIKSTYKTEPKINVMLLIKIRKNRK